MASSADGLASVHQRVREITEHVLTQIAEVSKRLTIFELRAMDTKIDVQYELRRLDTRLDNLWKLVTDLREDLIRSGGRLRSSPVSAVINNNDGRLPGTPPIPNSHGKVPTTPPSLKNRRFVPSTPPEAFRERSRSPTPGQTALR